MADSQNKIDAAAEKAFAEAAKKKAEVAAKAVAEQIPAVSTAATLKAATSSVALAPEAAPKKPAAKVVEPQKPAKPVKAQAAAPKLAAPKRAPTKAAATKPPVSPPAPVAAAPEAKPTTLNQLKDKIMANTETNQNQTTDFTSKMKDTAADMQSRAKAAYEKGTEMTAASTAFYKGNFDALIESSKVLASGMQDMGRTAVEDAKVAAETVTADVRAMAAVKSPTELFQLQGEIARRNLDAIVAKTSKNAEAMMKLANDAFAPLSSRASVAMERATAAA